MFQWNFICVGLEKWKQKSLLTTNLEPCAMQHSTIRTFSLLDKLLIVQNVFQSSILSLPNIWIARSKIYLTT